MTLEEIEARLKSIDGIPWKWEDRQVEAMTGYNTEKWLNSMIEAFCEGRESEFIIHAPDDIRWLIGQVVYWQEQSTYWRKLFAGKLGYDVT